VNDALIETRRGYLFAAILAFLVSAAILAGLLGVAARSLEVVLLALLAAVCIAPALISWLRGSLDVFEPIHYVSLVTFVYYFVAVIVHMQDDSFVMLGIDYRAQLPRALGLTILSLLSFYFGYYASARTAPWSSDTSGDERFLGGQSRTYARRLSLLVFAGIAAAIVLWILAAQFPLRTLFVFGEASYGDWWEESAGLRIGYLYAARESLAACFLLILATRRGRKWSVWHVVLLVTVAAFISGTGGRARVLLIVMSAWIFYYLERAKRPRILQLVLFGLFVYFAIIGAVGFYRGPGHSVQETAFGTEEAWDTFVSSSSVVVTSMARLHWVDVLTGFRWGRTFVKLGIHWIPGFLWPGKYTFLLEEQLLDYLARGAASTYWVMWFVDFGIPGIILGMVLLAWVARRFYDNYRLNQNDVFSQVALALFIPFLMNVVGRDDPTIFAYGMLYVFAPVWVVKYLTQRFRRR
jgi:oligosaccharide repeat unit polymerase